MACKAYLYEQDINTCIVTVNKNNTGLKKHRMHMKYYRELSMYHEENKHITSSTGKVNYGREIEGKTKVCVTIIIYD